MFYGWKIVGVTVLTHFVSVGFVFYSYGIVFKALAADFGGSRLQVSIGLSMMQVTTAVLAPFLGRLIDAGSTRVMMSLGALLMALGFLVSSQVTALWQLYTVLVLLLAPGAAMLGGLPGSALVANWFVERRGVALGIATVGVSLSGLVMAPVATDLIARFGWRGTFLCYGGLVGLVVTPVVAWLVVSRPEDMGLVPDGHPRARADTAAVPPVLPLAPGDQIIDHPGTFEWSSRGVLRERNFWVIALAVALNFCAMGSVLIHIVPHATDMGIAPVASASVLSAMAGMGIVGKLFFGWAADRGDRRIALWLASGIQALGVAGVMQAEALGGLLVAGGVFGLGMGGVVPLWGALIGAAFGRHAFGRVMGLMSPCMLPIQMLGIPFAGYVFDRSGSYTVAFRSFIVLYALAMAITFLLRLPAREVASEDPNGPEG